MIHWKPIFELNTDTQQGRPQDLGGGVGQEFFFSDVGICMSRSDMRIARGVRGHAPPSKFFKTVQFGAF